MNCDAIFLCPGGGHRAVRRLLLATLGCAGLRGGVLAEGKGEYHGRVSTAAGGWMCHVLQGIQVSTLPRLVDAADLSLIVKISAGREAIN